MFNKEKEFLKCFGQQYCYATTGSRTPYMKKCDLETAIEQNKKHKKDIYFLVNSGGFKEKDIYTLKACFVDIDAGKDKNDKYFKPSVLKSKKAKILKNILAFDIKPTYIVETRNGYHVYWLLDSVTATPSRVKLWKEIQSSLCEKLNGDENVLRLNQIMRVPGSMWYKDWANKPEKHLTKIVKFNNHIYTLNALANQLKTKKNKLSISKTKFETSEDRYFDIYRKDKIRRISPKKTKFVDNTKSSQLENLTLLLMQAVKEIVKLLPNK